MGEQLKINNSRWQSQILHNPVLQIQVRPCLFEIFYYPQLSHKLPRIMGNPKYKQSRKQNIVMILVGVLELSEVYQNHQIDTSGTINPALRCGDPPFWINIRKNQ